MPIASKSEFEEYLSSLGTAEPAPTKTKAPERSWGEVGTDAFYSLAGGGASLAKGIIATAVGNDNEAYDYFDRSSKIAEEGMSAKAKYQKQQLGQKLETGGVFDAGIYALQNPTLMGNMLVESLPAMGAGGGIGGVLARGAAAATATGTLGRIGTAVASGVGEGTIMATDVFDKTGDGAAALQALALGTVTGGLTPSNVLAGVARKGLGEAAETGVETLSTLQRKGATYAAGRIGTAVGQEAGQEFVQEAGQALIEQGANGGELDFRKAAAQGVVGAALGGVMGGGMHPIVGEGSKAAELEAAEKVLAKAPDNPVAQAEVALLRAQRDYVEAAPEARPALKQAVEVAQAAVTAARMPNSRAAQENLDTARAEAVVDNAGMQGARVAADAVSAETTQSTLEAKSADEAIESFAKGQEAHTTLTLDTQAVENTRAGVRQGVGEALAEEIERVRSGKVEPPMADVTANPDLFPIEEVAAPKVSDQIGLIRDTPGEVGAEAMQQREETPLPTINAEALGAEVQQVAIENDAFPTITGNNEAASTVQPGSDNQKMVDRVAEAETAMLEAGHMPVVAEVMRSANDERLLRDYDNIETSDSRAAFASALLEQRGAPIPAERATARSRLTAASDELAREIGQAPSRVRESVNRLSQEQAQNILSNPTVHAAPQQHAVVRALAEFRGWQMEGEQEAPTQEEDTLLSAEQIQELQKEGLVGSQSGRIPMSATTHDAFINNAPDEVTEALLVVERFQAIEGINIDPLEEATNTVLEWGLSDEGLESGAREGDMETIAGVRAVLGWVKEEGPSEEEQSKYQDELALETAPLDINEQIAELDSRAENEDLPDEQRSEARQKARELRRERDAQVRSGRESDHTPNPAPRATRSRAPVTRAGVRSVQTSFPIRAEKAKQDGTLLKLGKFFKTLMAPRNEGQRVLPRIDTSDLKARTRSAVGRGESIPQDILNQVRDRYNAKLKEMAERWAAENNVPLGTWVNPIRGISSRNMGTRAGFAIYLYGLGRGGRENPYAVRPNSPYTHFSADYSIHAVALQDAPGSADLAYRFAAEIANLRGKGYPADPTLTTVNPLRRQLQSLSADTMFGPGVINPLTGAGDAGMQGVTPQVWNTISDVEKIGLNALRSAHSITENRPFSATGGNWLENLMFDQQGRIVAYTDPKTPFGFPRGTVVSDEDLKAKIEDINPSTGFTTFGQRTQGTGGIGPDTAKLGILINTVLSHIEDKPDATIPRWVSRVARETGRDIGGWFFSEAEQAPDAAGITPAEAEGVLRETVGDTAAKVLLDTGLVRFVQTPAELAELGGVPLTSVSGAVQGATLPDGTIVLVTGNLTEKNAGAVLQHEALHATLKALVGEDTYNRLMSRLDTLLQAGEGAQWVADARAAVPANTPVENVLEETAAYAVEQYAKNPESTNPLVRWARDFMSAIRTAIIQNKALPEALRVWAIQNVQPQDFARMAIAGLKRAAQNQGPRPKSGNLIGLPTNVKVNGKKLDVGVWEPAVKVAEDYMASRGMAYNPPNQYVKVDPERATRIAQAYEEMKHEPNNPEVKAAFAALAEETIAQYEAVMASGLKVDFMDMSKGDPYAASPRLAIEDVRNNNHMSVFSTRDGYGSDAEMDVSDNPMLAETKYKIGGQPALVNDLFRVVHDYFGHVKEGVGFRADGEENAWRAHSAMFSPLAQRALTSETRGQNSWVNYGPHGEANRRASGADTVYAPQKTGLMPLWVSEEGRYDSDLRKSQRDWAAEIAALMEEHKTASNERRSEINDELRSLRAFQRAADELAFEKGFTNEPSNIRGKAAGVPAQAEYGVPREGAVAVDATHFSNSQRNQLSTAAYGTGAKGEEAGRLSAPENADIRDRTHFYVNEGSGIRPEAGVGGVAHNVKLNNLYDIKADPLGYRAFNRENPSAMERAIVNAGFDGYYAPDYANGQGVAVVIGRHTIPVSPGEGGTNVVAQFQGDTYAANLAKSKLPAGRMTGREWLVAIRNTEFDTPPVRAALQAREAQTLYRDDLPRFNKPDNGNMRFSIAQEMNHITEPVAPSPAPLNELTIRDASRRTPMERIYEMVRKAIQDKHVTLRRIQQIAGVTSEQLEMDTMGALDRLGSKMSSTHKRLVKEPLAAIETILYRSYKDGEVAHREMNTLLKMLHVPEYNRRISTVNPAKYDAAGELISGFDEKHPGSGIDTAEAQAKSAELLSGPHGEALAEAVKVYREMITNLQEYAVAQGLEKQEVIDAWRDPETGFSNYTPFHRELDLEENLGIGTARGAQGFSLRTGITQRAMGSSKEIFDPLAATLILGTRIVSRGENAVVARTMLEFAKNVVPNFITRGGNKRPMWKVDVIPQTRVIKRTNIYKTQNADGTMSPEFYNREQARLYADAQQALWEQRNPGADPNTSGIIAELIDTADRVFIQPVPNALNQPNVMVVPVEGENHIITFDENSQDAMGIMNALKGTGTFGGGKSAKVLNRVLTPFRMFSRWTVALATGFNPMFIPFNAARDIQAAMINAKDGGIPGWTWGDSRKIGMQFLPAAYDINKRLAEEFEHLHSNQGRAPDAPRGSWGWWMDQAEQAGGLTGIMEHIVEPEEARTMIRRLYGAEVEQRAMGQDAAVDWLTKAEGAALKIGDMFYRFGQGETSGTKLGSWASKQLAARVGRYNSAAEAATRTIVFKGAFEKYMAQDGMTEAEAMKLAANISKNISTNFNRRGDITTFLNQLFPFFNAAIQGSGRLAEAVFQKHPVAINRETGDKVKVAFTNDANGNRIAVNAETKAPIDMSKVTFDQETTYLTPFGKQVIGSLATAGAMQSVLLLMAGFDDDEPPQSVKDRAFIIPLGGKDYMAIPMPHGFNTLINFGREMTDAVAAGAQGEGMKAAQHIINATAGQAAAFNPLGGQGNVWLGISPALTDPAIALYMNKDVFGRQIAREDMNPRDVTPGFTRSKEGVSWLPQQMAKGLNYLTGGNEDQPGFISPTGDQIGYLFGELGGGVAREGAKLVNAGFHAGKAAAGVEQEEMPVSKMPLIGRIFGTTSDAPGLRTRAFEISKELNSLDNRYKGLKDRGDKEGAAAFKAAHPELSLADDFNRFYREDSKARKQRALSRGADDIEKVNRITETQTEKAKRLLSKYDALVQ